MWRQTRVILSSLSLSLSEMASNIQRAYALTSPLARLPTRAVCCLLHARSQKKKKSRQNKNTKRQNKYPNRKIDRT